MASIPLPQFPPEFKPKCFKCSSLNVHFNFTKHSWAWNQSELQYSCGVCGVMAYGEDAIIAKFSLQLKDWRREQEEAKVRAKEAAERRVREAAEAEARRKEEERIRAEEEETARRIAVNGAEMKRRAEENAAMVAAALERRRLAALERKRAHDRERKARSRAAARAAKEAAPPVQPVANPTPQQLEAEARLQAARERKREIDRAYRARVRAAARAAADVLPDAPPPPPAPPVPAPEIVEDPTPPTKDEGDCAWKDCDKPRVGKSKYCSRNCSNKNARWNASRKAVGGS